MRRVQGTHPVVGARDPRPLRTPLRPRVSGAAVRGRVDGRGGVPAAVLRAALLPGRGEAEPARWGAAQVRGEGEGVRDGEEGVLREAGVWEVFGAGEGGAVEGGAEDWVWVFVWDADVWVVHA